MTWALGLQGAAAIASLASAWLWWRSSLLRLSPTSSLVAGGRGTGNRGVVLSNGDTMVWDIEKQGQLNAWAAGGTALASLLQAAAIWLQAVNL